MTRRLNDNILPGQAANQEEVVRSLKARGYFDSGVPRTGCDVQAVPKSGLSPGELFEHYADALALGRKKQFLKSLSHDQFQTLCASLERSNKS